MVQARKFTRNLMAKFPSWMKMSKDPESYGATFLDVFGVTFEEFQEELDYVTSNFYIDTADIDMVDILYRVPLTLDIIDDFQRGGIGDVHVKYRGGAYERINIVHRVRHLYDREGELPLGLIDRETGYLYLRMDMNLIEDRFNPFDHVVIGEAEHFNVEFHHVWNAFDEFGFLLGLKRLPLEDNETFKNRILDVFRNPGGNTNKGITSGLSRELGLSEEEVNIYNMDQKTYSEELVNPDGSPTKKMREYAKKINNALKFTVDTLNLGEAYWQTLEENNLGIHFLPHIWDIDESIFESQEFQSGVGYDDDLKVTKPKEGESTFRDFNLKVSLVGYYEDYEEFYPEITFQYKIYAKGKLLENEYEEQQYKYTVVAGEEFEQKYSLTAFQDFMYKKIVSFDDENDFYDTPDKSFIHFGKSNDFLNSQTDTMQRISLYMSTRDELISSNIKELRVVWEDKSGIDHDYVFNTRDKWIMPTYSVAGNVMSTPVTSASYYDEDKEAFELGRGNFNEEIKTTSDFLRGKHDTNFTVIKDGKLSLNLSSMNQIIN